mmetsp:Transcript_10504/g.35645  ORF Transcript_10504/g.35645 Transcript_10504/m.35645 type:complete len:167 (+) Transcript_10504:2330-2830(+)
MGDLGALAVRLLEARVVELVGGVLLALLIRVVADLLVRGLRAAVVGLAAAVAAAAAAPPARASYTLYKAASDARDERVKEGTWKQGVDINDAYYQGMGARTEAEKIRRDRYASDAKQGKAGKFCAGQMSVVSPQMENICVRYGLSKADRATQYIDEFGNAQQPRKD